jgi:fibronectin-binding autotransporter adhesin
VRTRKAPKQPRRGTLLVSAVVGLVVGSIWTVGLGSASTVEATATAPANTAAPSLVGTARQGSRLGTSTGVWVGSAPLVFGYQWQRCDAAGANCADIVGATGATRTLTGDSVGRRLRVVVTATNDAGSQTASSAVSSVVVSSAANAPRNVVAPTIRGELRLGTRVKFAHGVWSGATPIRLGLQWLRCDASGGGCVAIPGATDRKYVVDAANTNKTLRLLVTANNSAGTNSAVSRQSNLIAAAGPSATPPVNTREPSISGLTRVGERLSTTNGVWTGTAPISFRYQWLRCDSGGANCVVISGATDSRYRTSSLDIGHRMRVLVRARNSAGEAAVQTNATGAITSTASVPVNAVRPSISGTPRQGNTLAANPGVWTSASPISFSYQWTRCNTAGAACAPIPGAIGTRRTTYQLVGADVGHRILVQIKASNRVGPAFVNSPTTAVVNAAAGPPPPSGNTVAVAGVSLPDRLLVDQVQFSPSRIYSQSQPLIARIHVIEANGRKAVSGALVYAVGVPFDRLTAPPEARTDSGGWATITFYIKPTFQLRHGNLVVVFVRARKPGENPLGGISTRRLISVRVA